MVDTEVFRYDGKRVLVVGAATGMGAATAQLVGGLGAEVVALDVAEITYPVAQAHAVDLRDRESVERVADEVGGRIDAVFACAGVADGTPGIMLINFVAQRALLERLLERGTLGRGSSIAMISSVAGLGWQQNLDTLLDFLAQPGWDAAAKWIEAHDGTDNYSFSKMAINAWVGHDAFRLLEQGVRVNAILPGPTDTPLARANADIWLTFAADYRAAAGVETLVPAQMAGPLAFLCSDAASGITGITLLVDSGHVSSAITGSFSEPAVQMMLGGA
jgi:NAD(P)-dependent dehydrogenase (short-subunit alcohol dehydrogenase family)